MNEYKNFKYYEDKGLTGLKNLGNTCYMNSSIQCLSHTMDLVHYFMSKKMEEDVNVVNFKRVEYHLVLRFRDLLYHIWNDNQILSPKTFKMTLEGFVKKYVGYDQHDAQECITYILDIIHRGLSTKVDMNITGKVIDDIDKLRKDGVEAWKSSFENNYSYIIELFYGQMYTKIECPKCEYKSNKFETFSSLSVSIPSNKDNTTLEECIDKIEENEVLDDENKWYCEECKDKVNGLMKSKIWKLPDILIVDLKRFTKKANKINTKINFNIESLDLTKYISENKRNNKKYEYELYGVVNHRGDCYVGHYWSLCKRGGEWYNFNDTTVSKIKKEDIITSDNYVLFFKRLE